QGPNRPSFRVALKARARNPYSQAVVMDSGLAAVRRPGMTGEGPVNSSDNADNLRILTVDLGIPKPLSSESPHALKSPHALYAPIPRRAARPASGLGSRGQARQAEEGGAGVEGPVAVPAGEDAVLYRQ